MLDSASCSLYWLASCGLWNRLYSVQTSLPMACQSVIISSDTMVVINPNKVSPYPLILRY
ncbi:hypothetical protein GBAR_LOCUS3958 [Geodia barretti]|uniref:Uncharacterized protein n=1 Tax=Geodia barretti TaxID=519541 RepID=A0AA35R6U8_GEOBA|nr:hypothetical protein GBAR_LOCUS3958 [Geodia barretti]